VFLQRCPRQCLRVAAPRRVRRSLPQLKSPNSAWHATVQETAACFRTWAQRSSPHTPALTRARRPRQTTALSRSCATLSLKKGDGQKNRRLVTFSFRFLSRFSERRCSCPGVCPNSVPKTRRLPTMQSIVVLAFNDEGGGLDGGRLHCFAVERFRVSVFVTYTCRRAVRWPRG
jgi:hypothetical protein